MKYFAFSNKKFAIAFIITWLILFGLHCSILLSFKVWHTQALADSFISNFLLAVCGFVVNNNLKYYLPKDEKYWYVFIISFVLSCFWLLLTRASLWLLFKEDEVYMQMLRHSSPIRYGIAFLITGFMAMMSLMWHSQKENQLIEERKADAEKMAREAELYKLRQQLQPHFLFNSLNSISALTGTQPEKARKMIEQLSDFLRGTLKKDEHQWHSLREEIQYLELYLDIEKVRFGYRLQTTIEYDEEISQLKLPAMLLQPVVENAIKFGLYDTIGEVIISIHAEKNKQHLKITITNPFDAETSQPLKGTGFGLSSINRRLYLLFGRYDLLQTTQQENNFITTILIPQI